MTTAVEKTIEVNAPIRAVYDQWTQFEDFPQFMGGVSQVRQLDDVRLHWVAEIAAVKREWDARILEQIPDTKIAWAATEGATNAGAVFFTELTPTTTLVRLSLEYAPEGLIERAGDALGLVETRAAADLLKFKEFIEARGVATGGWRGGILDAPHVGAPGIEHAEQTRGDGGKAGISGKAAVVGAATAVVGVAAAAALKGKSDDKPEEVATLPPAEPVREIKPAAPPVVAPPTEVRSVKATPPPPPVDRTRDDDVYPEGQAVEEVTKSKIVFEPRH